MYLYFVLFIICFVFITMHVFYAFHLAKHCSCKFSLYQTQVCNCRMEIQRKFTLLPRCMECRRRLAMRILSVRPWIVTKRKKDMLRFLYHTKDHLSYLSEKKNGWWGRPLLSEILGQPTPVGVKSPILNR